MLENLMKDYLALVDNGIEVKDLPLSLKPQGFFSYLAYGIVKANVTVEIGGNVRYVTINIDCKPLLPLVLHTENYGDIDLSKHMKHPTHSSVLQVVSRHNCMVVENCYLTESTCLIISRKKYRNIIIPALYKHFVFSSAPKAAFMYIDFENYEVEE